MNKSAFIIVCCFLLFILSCSKKEDNGESSTASAAEKTEISEATRRVTEKPSETMTMELVERDSGEAEADEEAEADDLPPLPGKEFLLVKQASEAVAGEDLVIGELHHVSAANAEENAVYKGIRQFLHGLTNGVVEREAVHSDNRDDLTRLLEYHLKQGNIPGQFRIGQIFIEDSTGRADVRLLGGFGRAAGEIYCTEEGGSWVVTDLQVDLAELGKSYEIDGPYEPNVYRWIHQY